MIRIFAIICSILFLVSCNRNAKINDLNAVKYYWVKWSGHEYKKPDSMSINIERSQIGDTTILNYFTNSGSAKYYIINKQDSSFVVENPRDSLVHPLDSILYIRLFRDTTVYFDSDTFKVRMFIQDENIQDGAAIIYYEPSIGLYAGHSDTWPGLKILQSSDTAINRKIRRLILATIPRFFIRNEILKQ